MTLKKLIFAGALGALITMASAVAPAYADSIAYTLTDGSAGDVITFTLLQDPTTVATNADWFAVSTTVTVDGVSKTEDVTFYDTSFDGGLSIASTPETDQILDQQGNQLFSGSTSSPKLLTESNVSLTCIGIGSGTPCSADKYDGSFKLNAVDIPTATPEPGSLALMLAGLGFLGLVMVKARA
jgi:PEP-CTERM motif-containing protein